MGNRTLVAVSAQARLRGCGMILLGSLIGLCVGCNPQSLSMLLMPFMDNKVEPAYKLFAADKEVKLVILTDFAQKGIEMRDEVRPAEIELPEQLAQYFRDRCTQNKHKIKIVSQTEVRNFLEKERLEPGDYTALEIGKQFKADYVLDLNIQTLQVYKPLSFPKMFQGNTRIIVSLYKISGKEGNGKVFGNNFTYGYPGEGSAPVMAGNADPAVFRGMFLNRVARDISKMFIAFDPDEKRILE